MRIAIVLWTGRIGGAERVSIDVVRAWRDDGIDGSLVFVQESLPLAERLPDLGIPFTALEFAYGRGALRGPRRFAAAVGSAAPDGVVLTDCGYPAVLLRLGGYRAPIAGVEHGALLQLPDLPRRRRWRRRLERALGARARSVDFAVSEFMLGRLRAHSHARETRRLYNGVDLDRFAPRPAAAQNGAGRRLVIGSAGRFVEGKGFDQLIRAVATVQTGTDTLLRLAGDGPERPRLEALASGSDIADRVEFVGSVEDMPSFWNACDVAVVPSDTFAESFSMTTVEAMACGRPVVATVNGGIPEVLADAGTLVPAGSVEALAEAVSGYLENPVLRAEHGRRARLRAEREFDIVRTARVLADCFRSAEP